MDSDLIYPITIDPSKINGKNILITGGTGSFGKKMIATMLKHFNPNKIIIYSRDEYKQSLLKEMFHFEDKQHPCLRFFIGDVRDLNRLTMAMRNVDIVFHTSALKRVQECEYNPMEAIRTNIIGTDNVVQAAILNGVKYVVGLSTDKACAPVNLYGGTKLCAEKVLVNGNLLSGNSTKVAAVRYGNQLNSRGSLVEIFSRLTDQHKELTVTDPDMTRFTILLQEAVNFVLMCLDVMIGGEIFIPKLPSYSVKQMVKAFDGLDNYRVIGARSGEKKHELMISGDESHTAYEYGNFFILVPPKELQIFDVNAYSKSDVAHKYSGLIPKQREANLPYSSGDSQMISDERLKKLIQTGNN